MNVEKQELYCHACGMYVQFDLDLDLNGKHVLDCPNCGHEHCRYVHNGRISDRRWDRRNGPQNGLGGMIASMQTIYGPSADTYGGVFKVTGATFSTKSTWDNQSTSASANAASLFTYRAWMNTTITS